MFLPPTRVSLSCGDVSSVGVSRRRRVGRITAAECGATSRGRIHHRGVTGAAATLVPSLSIAVVAEGRLGRRRALVDCLSGGGRRSRGDAPLPALARETLDQHQKRSHQGYHGRLGRGRSGWGRRGQGSEQIAQGHAQHHQDAQNQEENLSWSTLPGYFATQFILPR